MNIEAIRAIVNSSLPESEKRRSILLIIADDKKAIPFIMEILDNERHQTKELLLDTNSELSRALVVLNDSNLKYTKKIIADPKWVVGEIKKHYIKWKDYISCTFKVDGLQ